MHDMLKSFREALTNEPDLLPFGVGECIKDIYRSGSFKLPPPEKAVQSTLNNHMCRVGKRYNPDLVNIAASARDNFIFDSSRLFPLVSLEWLLATLEVWFHHGHALGWLGNKLEKKCLRILKQQYGTDMTKTVKDIIIDCKEISSLNWNHTIFEFIETYVCGVKSRMLFKETTSITQNVSLKRHTNHFVNELLTMFGFTWGAKELLDLESFCFETSKSFAEQEACSIIYVTLVSFIGPTSKHNIKK